MQGSSTACDCEPSVCFRAAAAAIQSSACGCCGGSQMDAEVFLVMALPASHTCWCLPSCIYLLWICWKSHIYISNIFLITVFPFTFLYQLYLVQRQLAQSSAVPQSQGSSRRKHTVDLSFTFAVAFIMIIPEVPKVLTTGELKIRFLWCSLYHHYRIQPNNN